jgi:RimJ/RimL family protein N-acetyltransferase
MSREFILQPQLHNDLVKLIPLQEKDSEVLYNVASDPLIWEQHPNKDRYKREVFLNFFKGAIESGGAFLILKASNSEVIGSSRFYDFNGEKSCVTIGYTFFARQAWGSTYNKAAKTLMLDHAFRFVDEVFFHIGAVNIRSQKAIIKLGAVKIEEKEMAYYGEKSNLNFVYSIKKQDWESKKKIS